MLHLVQQNNIFECRPKLVFDAETKALNVDDECKQFCSYDVSEKFVTHANIDMSALHKSRQVSN